MTNDTPTPPASRRAPLTRAERDSLREWIHDPDALLGECTGEILALLDQVEAMEASLNTNTAETIVDNADLSTRKGRFAFVDSIMELNNQPEPPAHKGEHCENRTVDEG